MSEGSAVRSPVDVTLPLRGSTGAECPVMVRGAGLSVCS